MKIKMFDLKIITVNDKKADEKKENNLLEYIEAIIELFKLNSNNLSLTNTIEIFVFYQLIELNHYFELVYQKMSLSIILLVI